MTTITNNISTNKPQNFNTKHPVVNDRQYIPSTYKKVAASYEKQFARFMLDQLKKTVNKTKKDSTADQFYKGLLDDKYADKLIHTGNGLGLQDVILDQIYPKKFRNKIAYNAYLNSQKLSRKDNNFSKIKIKGDRNE